MAKANRILPIVSVGTPARGAIRDVAPPDHLSDTAKELWPFFIQALSEARLLATLDLVSLEMLVEAYAEVRMARRMLAEYTWSSRHPVKDEATGETYIEYVENRTPFYPVADKDGNERMVAHPAFQVLAEADKRFHRWAGEFGLTPNARARLIAALTREGHGHEEKKEFQLDDLSPDERHALRQMIKRRTKDD